MKAIHAIAFILLVIGGLNWLVVGISSTWDLANLLGVTLAQIVYILVGVSALYLIFTHKKSCKHCDASQAAPMM